jgi:hypothetical protein
MFIGILKYERLLGKTSLAGRPVFRLTESLSYKNDEHLPGYIIRCEVGFETDFASIPSFIFFLRPKNGKWKTASVIHDKACILASKKMLTYKEADTIFYYAMLDDEASKFTANFIYFWCRLHNYLK